MSSITIDLQVAPEADKNRVPKKAAIKRWVAAALAEQKQTAEMCIRVVGDGESQALNSQYRGKDKPTNVLSFPCELPPGVDLPVLGDLVICEPVVSREAREQDKTPEAHWAHMVIHGTLHLLGYDHMEDDEAREMEALETNLLTQLGYPAPYEQPVFNQ